MSRSGLYEPRGMDWKHVRDLVVADMELTKGNLDEVTTRLIDYAFDMNSLDNISVILTAFHKTKVASPQISYKNVSGQGESGLMGGRGGIPRRIVGELWSGTMLRQPKHEHIWL